jgi:hypothetical protein
MKLADRSETGVQARLMCPVPPYNESGGRGLSEPPHSQGFGKRAGREPSLRMLPAQAKSNQANGMKMSLSPLRPSLHGECTQDRLGLAFDR